MGRWLSRFARQAAHSPSRPAAPPQEHLRCSARLAVAMSPLMVDDGAPPVRVGFDPCVGCGEMIAGLAKLVLSKPGVDKVAVMMSIVSNTRVDIVARGVIKACIELGHDPAEKIAIFRIPGAWEEEGFKILERYGVLYADRTVSLNEAARRAAEAV